jgi:hypothetical protein
MKPTLLIVENDRDHQQAKAPVEKPWILPIHRIKCASSPRRGIRVTLGGTLSRGVIQFHLGVIRAHVWQMGVR